jgi:hypothetical protein
MGKNYEVTLGSSVSSTAVFEVAALQIYKGIPELKSILKNDFGENGTGNKDCMGETGAQTCEIELAQGSEQVCLKCSHAYNNMYNKKWECHLTNVSNLANRPVSPYFPGAFVTIDCGVNYSEDPANNGLCS